MKILAIIPARSGSKGVPGKNTKLLGNMPLIYYTTNIATKLQEIDEVILSTDSEETAKLGRELGVSVPFKGVQIYLRMGRQCMRLLRT